MEKNLIIEQLTGKRHNLAKMIPLKWPLTLQIYISNVCNLKCEFCEQSKGLNDYTHKFMSFETFKLVIDRLKESPYKLKQVLFSGLGEPLLNSDIIEMISYVVKSEIAERVGIVTNGVKLGSDISNRLVEAGISEIRISINGLSDEDYYKYTGVKISFNQLLNNIIYFYNHRNDAKVYIKIMDYMVDDSINKEKFERIFGPIADVINIENMIPLYKKVDYKKLNRDFSFTQKGAKITETNICSLPFYSPVINIDGKVSACCVCPSPIVGDLKEQKFFSIWNGKRFNRFRRKMLDGTDVADDICKECKVYKNMILVEDRLDESAESLKNIYNRIIETGDYKSDE